MTDRDETVSRKRKAGDGKSLEERSKLMSKIKSKGTKFEIDFLIELKKRSRIKFEVNVSDIRGKPDIFFRTRKVCIFLDSDFWHGWQYPKWKDLLKNDYWRKKIEQNRRRDRRITAYLKKNGWKVARIWQHEIKNDKEKVFNKALNMLKNRESNS